MGVVFVAGIHAVGKTTVCQKIAHECQIPHFSAGALIKSEKGSAIAEQGKLVADVNGNQGLLVQGVNKLLSKHGGIIVVDGHFTLLNATGEIQRIELELFCQLNLDQVIVFQDDPGAIMSRMVSRDGSAYTKGLLGRHQSVEIAHARFICEELSIPFKLLRAFDSEGLKTAFDALILH